LFQTDKSAVPSLEIQHAIESILKEVFGFEIVKSERELGSGKVNNTISATGLFCDSVLDSFLFLFLYDTKPRVQQLNSGSHI
jgi:hypothetical protein